MITRKKKNVVTRPLSDVDRPKLPCVFCARTMPISAMSEDGKHVICSECILRSAAAVFEFAQRSVIVDGVKP